MFFNVHCLLPSFQGALFEHRKRIFGDTHRSPLGSVQPAAFMDVHTRKECRMSFGIGNFFVTSRPTSNKFSFGLRPLR